MSEDLKQYLKLQRSGSQLLEARAGQSKIRVAVVADHAPQQFTLVLKAVFDEAGYFPEVYEADYGVAAIEAFDRASTLYEFQPEAVVYSICVQKYRDHYNESQTAKDRETLADRYVTDVLNIVDALSNCGATVVVNNLALPIERQFGNFGLQTSQSLYGSVVRFNALLANELAKRQSCILNDIMYLANRVGAEQFFDERLWLSAKYPCANIYLPAITRSIVRSLLVRKGRVSKVLVLDLDNTLWGGVIGDDGLDGIRLGGDAEGDAYKAFQSYIKTLKDRGFVLAVCSKNNESTAMEVFRSHPEMVLREDDIALFVINWNDKASNIEYVSRVLKLGMDSFIFIDDMPFERDLVRTRLPMVTVPEMPADPAEYIAAVEFSGALESAGFSEEDVRRNTTYREEALRSTEQLKYGSIDEYLAGLSMKSECCFFQKEDIPRVAQLIQRSNQFNLRTQRVSEKECADYMNSASDRLGIQIRLADRFGDYGLIAVICCDVVDNNLFVTELVMSCRVLKRGVENLIMNYLFAQCERLGLKGIVGEYIATAKNAMVKDFYAQFGFEMIDETVGKTTWRLPLSSYTARPTFIL